MCAQTGAGFAKNRLESSSLAGVSIRDPVLPDGRPGEPGEEVNKTLSRAAMPLYH